MDIHTRINNFFTKVCYIICCNKLNSFVPIYERYPDLFVREMTIKYIS